MALGGYRPGSGRKFGSKGISVDTIRKQFRDTVGVTFEEALCDMAKVLITRFHQGEDRANTIKFMVGMSKYMIQPLEQNVAVRNVEDIPTEELDARINEYIKTTKNEDESE